jgi:hypothetical protein
MNKFKNIWTIEKNWWDSDIDVIKNSKWNISIYKKYYTKILEKVKDNPTFTIEDIKKYHEIQNNTQLVENKIILDEQVTLLWNKINWFVINILKLDESNILKASDIKTKQEVIITNPEFIKWVEWKDTFNEYLKYIEYQKAKQIKEIIQDNIISNKLFYPLNWWSFELSQISTFNIKVIKIENWIMYLTITDIANKISEIIKK